ncbi:MAG: 50S ribosomal protein L21 [Candidatus Binatia bacterium]
MYAIVKAGGKQHKVAEGDVVALEKIAGQPGDPVELGEVLFVRTGEGVHVGTPTLNGGSVKGEIVGQERGKKIIVFKHKKRKGYRRKQGHRQDLTRVRIQKIEWEEPSESRPTTEVGEQL